MGDFEPLLSALPERENRKRSAPIGPGSRACKAGSAQTSEGAGLARAEAVIASTRKPKSERPRNRQV